MVRKFNIGIDIDLVCEQYNITNYVIREDGKVDVDGDVNLYNNLDKLPLDFGVVKGHFNCSSNSLTSLEFAPVKVGGGFNCSSNKLTSLKGAPEKVGGYFSCFNNNLTSLEFAPEKVGGYFSCSYNNLTSLEFAPDYVGGGFYCYNNNLTSLEFAPKEVGGYFYCYNNNLLDIEALDKCRIGGELDISDNPIFNLVKDIVIRDLDVFYMIKPLQGNKLSRLLYDEVREDLRLPKFDYSTLHKDIELID